MCKHLQITNWIKPEGLYVKFVSGMPALHMDKIHKNKIHFF